MFYSAFGANYRTKVRTMPGYREWMNSFVKDVLSKDIGIDEDYLSDLLSVAAIFSSSYSDGSIDELDPMYLAVWRFMADKVIPGLIKGDIPAKVRCGGR